MAGIHGWLRGTLTATSVVGCSALSCPVPSFAAQARAGCVVPAFYEPASVLAGRPYLAIAYDALSRDRAQYAGLGPLSRSDMLQGVAERHSAYMASIGGWSDGDPNGWILDRVRATGLNATYAGQNVAAGHGASVEEALAFDEAFFAREAGTGGPHWANITNPNHHFIGMGAAITGTPGDYTVYLTQVFADAGACATQSGDTFSQASDVTPALRVGTIIHPSVDVLLLRSAPEGMVLQSLRPADHLKIVALLPDWAQVQVLRDKLYGWVSTQFVSTN